MLDVQGFTFEYGACYLGHYLEKTMRDGGNWEDVKYIFAAGQL